MTRRLWIFFLCLFATINASALDAVFNYAVFYAKDAGKGQLKNASLELFWEINPLSLHYHKNDNGQLFSQVQTDIIFKNAEGKTIHEDHYLLNTKPVAPEQGSTQRITDFQKVDLAYGQTSIQIVLTEPKVAGSTFTYIDSVTVETPANAPIYSTVQLLDTAFTSSDKTPFLKGNKQQVPIGTNFYDESRKVIPYYFELYQLDKITEDDKPVIQRVYISKKEMEDPLMGLDRKDTLTSMNDLSKLDTIRVSALPSGNYHLNVVLYNRSMQILTSRSAFFQLVNKHPDELPTVLDTSKGPVTYINVAKTFVAQYNLPQLKAILKMLLPVTDASDARAIQSFLKRPDEIYMRYFIYNYFARQNAKEPEKAWAAYADRIREINKMFGTGTTPGYETDRGYVWLKFGKPDDLVSVPSEPGALPYEVWQYYAVGKQNQEGVFLFYQPASAINEYKLLHSTVNGEIRNTNWRNILFTNGANNTSSRAEQYFRSK